MQKHILDTFFTNIPANVIKLEETRHRQWSKRFEYHI